MFWELTILVTCIKLLLIPAYHSTDFEVHRNWLAITHSLPVNKWYFESTSEWTLDYPPLFAFFEWLWSQLAQYFDPKMLVVDNLNYISGRTVIFQRLTVILSELLFIYSSRRIGYSLRERPVPRRLLFGLFITNTGLFFVDHIHFQYNGFLFGILLLSIECVIKHEFLMSAVWFTILICTKHIFIYMAPVYFVYFLRHYCFLKIITREKEILREYYFRNFLYLVLIVVSIVFLTLLPFRDHVSQVLLRLFPFKRGLCHAYWAPNFWALYNVADKIALGGYRRLGIEVNTTSAVMTGGLVQEYSHSVLPTITPTITFVLTGVALLPLLIKIMLSPRDSLSMNFIRSIVLSTAVSFIFGWHVHEKAILMLIIPLGIVALKNKTDASYFFILTIVGHYSLFPLLYPQNLLVIKVVLYLFHAGYMIYMFSTVHSLTFNYRTFISAYDLIYIAGLVPLFLYTNFIHSFLKLDSTLPFLPLMATSVYCSVGIIGVILRYYVRFMIE